MRLEPREDPYRLGRQRSDSSDEGLDLPQNSSGHKGYAHETVCVNAFPSFKDAASLNDRFARYSLRRQDFLGTSSFFYRRYEAGSLHSSSDESDNEEEHKFDPPSFG